MSDATLSARLRTETRALHLLAERSGGATATRSVLSTISLTATPAFAHTAEINACTSAACGPCRASMSAMDVGRCAA